MKRLPTLAVLLLLGPNAGAQVLTSQYDNARTGATLTEKTLTPANVNAAQFGKVFSFQVDGDVYAQPLYLPNVEVPGKGVHNVVYVATEHDSVYAFDADGRSPEPLWRTTFLGSGVTTVPSGDTNCPFIQPEVGITPTPVIDLASGTLYVLARTKERTGLVTYRHVQRLHALAITTGAEKVGSPVEIQASVNGTGAGSSNGQVPFDPLRELPRAGLLLVNGQVILTWASSCDVKPYHGWVMAYDARTLAQTAVFNTSPDGNEGGIWQSDMAPAADAGGFVYAATGNGTFDAAAHGRNYGDSLLKLRLAAKEIVVHEYFTPTNEPVLNDRDLDFGSGGPLLLPDQPGARPHLVLIAGKDGRLYVLDRDRLQSAPGDGDRQAVQILRMAGGAYATPAYWNGHVYVLTSGDFLKDFAVKDGRLSDAPAAMSARRFANPGAAPTVSADGTRNGIVWLIETKVWNDYDSVRPSVLHAFEAANVAHELYTSAENGARDQAGKTVRFTVPTVANGRVYVGAKGEVDVYGLLSAKPR